MNTELEKQNIEYVRDNKSINNSGVQKLLNVSKPKATRLLQQAEKWLEQQGKVGKGTNYIFKWKSYLIGSQLAHETPKFLR